jgi:type 1 glutamine amidotransferase
VSWAGQIPLNVLVVSGGCCHDYPAQNQTLYDVLNPVAPINWTFALGMSALSVTQGKLPLYSDPDWASRFDLVIHNECWANGDFPPVFMKSLTLGHDRGIPAMMIHCSLHSYRQSPIDDWRELIGVTSRRHTFAHNIKVDWSQSDPIAKGMAEWTTPTDELYVVEKVWPGATTVASAVNNQKNDDGELDRGVNGPNETYPIAWTYLYKGSTRVFGTSLGHGNPTWDEPQFRELLVRGFRWTMGKDPQVGWTPTPPGMSAPPAPARGGGRGRGGEGGRGGAATTAPN